MLLTRTRSPSRALPVSRRDGRCSSPHQPAKNWRLWCRRAWRATKSSMWTWPTSRTRRRQDLLRLRLRLLFRLPHRPPRRQRMVRSASSVLRIQLQLTDCLWCRLPSLDLERRGADRRGKDWQPRRSQAADGDLPARLRRGPRVSSLSPNTALRSGSSSGIERGALGQGVRDDS